MFEVVGSCSLIGRTQDCRKQQQGYLFHTKAVIPHKTSLQAILDTVTLVQHGFTKYSRNLCQSPSFKVLANEDTLLHCRHKCFPVCPRAQHLLRTQILCPGHKNVSDFVQKHLVSATNVSQFARARKRHEQQCFRNNVSSFATAFTCDPCHTSINTTCANTTNSRDSLL